MPRIYDSGNDPLDFCQDCYPTTEVNAFSKYGDVTKTGVGPDDRGNCFGYDAEHPEYDGTGYKCYRCHAVLTNDDN